MGKDYIAVMQRLKEERLGHGLSQAELGEQISVSQKQYSKVEHDAKSFGYFEVKALANTELDLYYIYTGMRMSGKYNRLFERSSYKNLLCYLHIMTTLFTCMCEELELEQELYRQINCVRYITGADEELEETIFSLVRQQERETQFEIAARLGVDVKKYRELERGNLLPDSELIWRLYARYHVPPALVLQDAKGLIYQIEYFLERPQLGQNEVSRRYSELLHDYYASIR